MIKGILRKLEKLNSNLKPEYLKFSRLPIDDKLVFLEGGQGTNINGNMFSMLREIKTNPRWKEYKTVFVVNDKNFIKAKKRMEFYGFDNVSICVRNSKEYCKYLATSKYLMTDNSFPPYFNKRKGQIYLNTWHGTPLKTLGISDKSNLSSPANIQKNYLMSDYALFPNEFTKNVFMEDYDLKNIFTGSSFIANYPRNYVFYDKQQGIKMKKTLGLSDKQVFAYMPTWRGMDRIADVTKQLKSTMKILREFDERLGDNQILLVNLHFLLESEINCDDFKHIKSFPSVYDTYEVLNSCDALITDYSSVFFDYAITEKKIILFAYDKEQYLGSRGIYISFDDLPFPIAETVDDVVKELSLPAVSDKDFLDKYCSNGWIDSCEKVFELMVTGKSNYFKLQKQENANKDLCVVYADKMPQSYFESIKAYINDNPNYNYVIAYRHNFTKENKDFVLSLDENISAYGTVSAFQLGFSDLVKLCLVSLKHKPKLSRKLNSVLCREAGRMFYNIMPSRVVDFYCGNFVMAGIIASLSGEKQYINHSDCFCVSRKQSKKEQRIKAFERSVGFEPYDMAGREKQIFFEGKKDNIADLSFSKNSAVKNIIPFYFSGRKGLKCISLFYFKTPVKTKLCDTYITVGENKYIPKYIADKIKASYSHFGIYSFEVPADDITDMPSTNNVSFCYENKYGNLVQSRADYCSLFYKFFFGLRSRIFRDKKTDTVAVFRQTRGNGLVVYVRSWIKSDLLIERIRQDFAYVLSLLWHGKKADSLVILYEKNSSKYEESASVTFEKLIDDGYKYAYFILDRDYAFIDRVPAKYKEHIVYKYSLKHYLYFFKAKTFIGTEQPVHAIDLKTFNVLALKKISDKNMNYVFLQHGVMYMVSLDSESRHMFKRKNLNGKYRVVVSSQAEADHFTQLGKHYPEDLYITGLPKFDRNELSSDADKIVIMPTWRPWEINMDRDNFIETPYFKMVVRIYNSVPDNLKEKVIILPHPLIANELKHLPESISDKIVINARYDDILKQSRILITDYSSIAYDAFYRGVRVIFYWEEKDFCMSQYGARTKLMLNEENVYGDYFYSTDGLSESIEKNYYEPQTEKYKQRYSKIVKFRDGRNTERLINALKDDGIIKL
ncbi:MAG: CDP-glycerol glycerophosphotransferase family protein [Eubacterium sp.]